MKKSAVFSIVIALAFVLTACNDTPAGLGAFTAYGHVVAVHHDDGIVFSDTTVIMQCDDGGSVELEMSPGEARRFGFSKGTHVKVTYELNNPMNRLRATIINVTSLPQ